MESQMPLGGDLRAWQRRSAGVLAGCVALHLVVMIYAVNGGLTASEIMNRLQGNWAFLAFYMVFALACAVHAPIGLLAIVKDWFGWTGKRAHYTAVAVACVLALVGVRTALVMFV